MEATTNDTTDTVEIFEYPLGKKVMLWNGREVLIEPSGYLSHLFPSVLHPKDCPQLCGFRGKEPSFFDNYFDSEAKKQNKFDIAVYQHHIRCNSEESKKHLEKSFEMMATGMVGVVVGMITFISKPGALAVIFLYDCKERIWKGVEEFKKAMETSNIPLENVHFVTWYDDYEKNTEELTKNSILEPWEPLDTSGFDLMDKQYESKQLDPSLSKNIRNYA
jgi:hypothetical protein